VPSAAPALVLALACALAGGLTAYRMFPLANRDPRTVLPGRWRGPVAVLTGLFSGLGALAAGGPAEVPLYLVLPVFGVLLAAIDLRSRLLPNALVLPFLGATGAGVLVAALGGGLRPLVGALLGGAVMFLFYLLLALISPSSMGMGDVKLAGVLGLVSGYAGLLPWLATLLGGFLFGGLAGIALLLSGRGRRAAFPFGPGMILAALVGVFGFSA
jgi:leader peptidase (prepilin peptidase)/N-methyltransferase